MRRLIKNFMMVSLSFLLAVVPAWALDSKQKQIIAMETVLAELDTQYGLVLAKERDFGVTIDYLRLKYSKLISDGQTLEEASGYLHPQERAILPPDEFRQLMVGMIAELRDGHANLMKNKKDIYGVGLYTALIDGKLYVADINKDLLLQIESSAVGCCPNSRRRVKF